MKQMPQNKNSFTIVSFRQPYTLQRSTDHNTVQHTIFMYHKTSNRSRVSNSSQVSNTSRGSKSDVLIEARSPIEAGSLIQAGYPIEAGCHLMTRLKTSQYYFHEIKSTGKRVSQCTVYGNCNCAPYIWKKFITLVWVWQVENVLIEAGSPIEARSLIQAGGLSRMF